MHTSMKIEKPGAVEVTLTVTMSLSDWIALRSQLCRNWPSWKLSEAINGLVDKLMAHVDYDDEEQTETSSTVTTGETKANRKTGYGNPLTDNMPSDA